MKRYLETYQDWYGAEGSLQTYESLAPTSDCEIREVREVTSQSSISQMDLSVDDLQRRVVTKGSCQDCSMRDER